MEPITARERTWSRLSISIPMALTLASGLILASFVYYYLENLDLKDAYMGFEADSSMLALEVEKNLEEIDHLREVEPLIKLFPAFGRKEFHEVAGAHFVHFRSAVAIEWIPRVPSNLRGPFEDAARKDGFPDFQFKEKDINGILIPEGKKNEYFPVFYIEPLNGNEAALGFDLRSEKTRFSALERSRDSGTVTATAKITLLLAKGNQPGFLAYVPVYSGTAIPQDAVSRKERLAGFILGVFRIENFVQTARKHVGEKARNIDIYLFDLSSVPANNELYRSPGERSFNGGFPKGFRELQEFNGPVLKKNLSVADRQWLMVAVPGNGYFASHSTWKPAAGFIFVALLSISLAGYIYSLKLISLITAVHSSDMENANQDLLKKDAALEGSNNELERALGDLTRSQELLIRTEKLSSIGTLSAGVAHEILNPLNTIGVITQTILLENPQSDLKERLREIMAQVKRATKITDNLRMFAHITKPEITDVDIPSLFKRTAALVEHQLKLDRVAIETSFPRDLPSISADQDKLAQVFLNLLTNARDALNGKKNGIITLTGDMVNGEVEIRFSDNGSGIPEESIGKIFDPFFSAKEPGKGTGLGLSVALSIIEGHNGKMRVESRVGEGTTFVITLPASGDVAAGTKGT